MHCVGARLIWQRHAPKEILLNGLLCVESQECREGKMMKWKSRPKNARLQILQRPA